MKGTPLEGMLIHKALSTLRNNLISGLEEKKEKLKLDSKEIEELVDNAYKSVYFKIFDE